MATDKNPNPDLKSDLVYVLIIRVVENDLSRDAEDIGTVSAKFKNVKRFGNFEITSL